MSEKNEEAPRAIATTACPGTEGSGAVRAATTALDPRVAGIAVAGPAPAGQVLVALGGNVATRRRLAAKRGLGTHTSPTGV